METGMHWRRLLPILLKCSKSLWYIWMETLLATHPAIFIVKKKKKFLSYKNSVEAGRLLEIMLDSHDGPGYIKRLVL